MSKRTESFVVWAFTLGAAIAVGVGATSSVLPPSEPAAAVPTVAANDLASACPAAAGAGREREVASGPPPATATASSPAALPFSRQVSCKRPPARPATGCRSRRPRMLAPHQERDPTPPRAGWGCCVRQPDLPTPLAAVGASCVEATHARRRHRLRTTHSAIACGGQRRPTPATLRKRRTQVPPAARPSGGAIDRSARRRSARPPLLDPDDLRRPPRARRSRGDRALPRDGGRRPARAVDRVVPRGPLFERTEIFGSILAEDLVARLIAEMRGRRALGPLGTRVVGRPVRFAGDAAHLDERLALSRLRSALARAGFHDVTFELEPVAAAHHYGLRITGPELVLIGDFGGGTSDFSVLRLEPGGGRARAEVLGTGASASPATPSTRSSCASASRPRSVAAPRTATPSATCCRCRAGSTRTSSAGITCRS